MDRLTIEHELDKAALLIAELATDFCLSNSEDNQSKNRMYKVLVRYSALKKELAELTLKDRCSKEHFKSVIPDPSYEEVITNDDDAFQMAWEELKVILAELESKRNIQLNITDSGDELLISRK